MDQIMENIGIIVFIAVIVISVLFNTVNAKLKEAAAAAERSRDYQKKPHKFNPFSSESPEEFFERVRQEERASQKLKLNKKHQMQKKPVPLQALPEPEKQYTESRRSVNQQSETIKKTSLRRANKIDITDKNALRKAIIINEVLSPPKAYDM